MELPETQEANTNFPASLLLPACLTNREAVELPKAAFNDSFVSTARSPTAQSSLFPPGLSVPDGTPSHGSALHDSGNCRPCAWFWKADGCKHGGDCQHCHICPEGELKARKKNKAVMMRLGLATPKPFCDVTSLTSFFPLDQGYVSEQDVSTTCSSPEQEALITCTPDEDGILISVINSLGLEDTLLTADKVPSLSNDYSLPGLHATPNTPSHGVLSHAAGTCKPCAWFWKPSGCQNGTDCAYCHLCSEGELKARKKSKHTAMRLGLVTPKVLPNSECEARYALNLASCI